MTHRAPILFVALALLLAGAGSDAAQPTPEAARPARRVLFLFGEPRLTPAIVAVDTVIRSTLESGLPGQCPSTPSTWT